MKRLIARSAACLVLGLGLAACDRGGASSGEADEAAVPPADPALVASETQWRAERLERLLAEDGWTSLIGLHWLELRAHYIGSDAASGIRLAAGPPKLGLVQQEGSRVFFTPERDVEVNLDESPVTGRIELFDAAAETPTELLFDEGRGRLSLIRRGGRTALRAKHVDAVARTGFGTIDYWPLDARWVLDGRFVPHPAGRTIEIANIIGGVDALPNPGAVEFSRDGIDYRLEALPGEDGSLFLIFADRTSGQGSYGAGRYLDVGAPDAEGRVGLNFNRSYNPPCAFTDFATCPLPPTDNRLDVAIAVGEKSYVKPAPPAAPAP